MTPNSKLSDVHDNSTNEMLVKTKQHNTTESEVKKSVVFMYATQQLLVSFPDLTRAHTRGSGNETKQLHVPVQYLHSRSSH